MVIERNARRVVVAIPVYRAEPEATERIAWRQCLRVLGSYDIRLVAPRGLDLSRYEALVPKSAVHRELAAVRFPSRFFQSVASYSRLMLSPGFYRSFFQYEYVLVHQLDAFVFNDELMYWCQQGYDYIGAPWFEGFAAEGQDSRLHAVGNGGFSLRRIAAIHRVLHTFAYVKPPKKVVRESLAKMGSSPLRGAATLIRDFTIGNNTFHLFNDYKRNEDLFFGFVAKQCFDWFRVPEPEVALGFSFEVEPRLLYSKNGYRLPFGCHGFAKYDPEFWAPFTRLDGE